MTARAVCCRTLLCALAWTLLSVASLSAQEVRRVTVDVAVGASVYDFGGADEESRESGAGFVLASRVSIPLVRALIVEAGVTYFQHERSFAAQTSRSLFPELGVQLVFPSGPWWPYVGIGGGWQQILDTGGGTNGTVHGSAGVRRRLSRHWGVRGEMRGRIIVPFAFMADLTLGGGWTF